jgi:hypothetical protein
MIRLRLSRLLVRSVGNRDEMIQVESVPDLGWKIGNMLGPHILIADCRRYPMISFRNACYQPTKETVANFVSRVPTSFTNRPIGQRSMGRRETKSKEIDHGADTIDNAGAGSWHRYLTRSTM